MENFTNHLTKFAASKGFAIVTGSPFYNSCLKNFNVYSEWYKSVMPYEFFVQNIAI